MPLKYRVTEAPSYAPPRFCAGCGRALMDRTTTIEGSFDQWTGVQDPSTVRRALACSEFYENPDDSKAHDRWVRTDGGWLIA